MKISVILPTYDERENIIPLIKETENNLKDLPLEYEILVVDDNSPDKTGEAVRQFTEKHQNVRCMIRQNEKGLASAIKEGIKNTTGDLLIIMDTDFSHPPSAIPLLFQNLKDNDMIIASRYVEQGSMDAPRHKYLGSLILNKTINIILGFDIKDSTGGFFLFKRKILENLDLEKIFDGYGEFSFKLLYALRKNNKHLKEVPFRYGLRRHGESKTNLLKTGFSYLYEALKTRLDL